MFKTIFTKLCNERGESPTAVCLKLGLSNSAYTAWREDTTPRLSTLLRIAEYFDVSVDYLLGRETSRTPFRSATDTEASVRVELAPLTDREIRLMMAYRARMDVRLAVNKLLDLTEDDGEVVVYRAAESRDDRPAEVVRGNEESMDATKNANESEDPLL